MSDEKNYAEKLREQTNAQKNIIERMKRAEKILKERGAWKDKLSTTGGSTTPTTER